MLDLGPLIRDVPDFPKKGILFKDITTLLKNPRAFKQSMGMTPTNYIAERRIEGATKLLQETDLPIAEIALRSGFSSQSHFTTSFRRVAGATPRAFRATI